MEFIQMRSISGSNKAVPEKLSSFPAAQVIAEAHWTKVFNTLLLGWDWDLSSFVRVLEISLCFNKLSGLTLVTETVQLKHPAQEGLRR